MNNSLFEPFVQGTLEMLEMMTGLTGEAGTSIEDKVHADISASIQISGQMTGQLTLAFAESTAQGLVGAMLGLEVEELDREMIGDCVGEMVNIVAGQAKAAIEADSDVFALAIPSIVNGPRHTVELFKGTRHGAQTLNTEFGELTVALWLEAR